MLKSLITTFTLALAMGPALVKAADTPYPTRPVTLVVPYAAGGGTDTLSRALGEEMRKQMGQPFIVVNRPGASGIIGTNAGAKAPADGYTVLITLTQAVLNNQFLYAKLPYDTRKELAFISEVATPTLLLTASNTVPAHTVKEMLSWASKNKVNFGSWGVGSYGHLVSAYLAQSRKIDLANIAYKGEAPMLQDLAGGQIQLAFSSLASAKPFVDSGKVRVLAVTGDHRLPTMPNVPTLAEAGLSEPEYTLTASIVMMAPAGTPAPILDRLGKEARVAINSASFRARLQVLGLEPIGNDSRKAIENYEAMYPVQQRLVKLTGAKLD